MAGLKSHTNLRLKLPFRLEAIFEIAQQFNRLALGLALNMWVLNLIQKKCSLRILLHNKVPKRDKLKYSKNDKTNTFLPLKLVFLISSFLELFPFLE